MYADSLKGGGRGGGGVWVVIDPDLKFQTHTQTIYCEFDIVHSATCNPLDVTCKHTSKL